MLHLVHGSPHLGALGGTELYVDALATATEQAVLCPGDRWGRLDAPYPLWSLGRRTLAEALAELAPELLHVHHLSGLGARLPALPRLLTLHDYSLICARGQLVDRELQRCPGPWPSRCARCVWSPGPLGHLRALNHALGARRVLEGARLLAPSQDLATRFGRLSGHRVHVIDLPLVAPVRPAPAPGLGPVRFLFLGSLLPTKGPQHLVEAFEGLPGTLDLYGPRVDLPVAPDFFDELMRQIESTPGARYGGTFGAEQRQHILDQHDVLVVPSTWPENSPLVVREALAAGLRVVGSALGGVGELDPSARLVPPKDVAALRGALRAEIALGRGRRAPRTWPMEAHVEALSVHYAACSRSPSS